MSDVVAPEEQLEWEARAARPAGAAAIAAAVLLILSAFYGPLFGHAATPYAEQFLLYDKHPADLFVPYTFQILSDVLLAGVLYYLFKATKARRPELSRAMGWVALGGPTIAALCIVVQMFAINNVSGDFAASPDAGRLGLPPAAAVAKAGTTTGSASGVYAANRLPAEVKAYDLLRNDGLAKGTAFLALAANLAFGFALVFVSLNAMRVGLFSRVMGIFGILVGVITVLFQGAGVIEAFWLGAAGALILGAWPNGRGPAWATVEAIPWPSAMEARQAQMEDRGGDDPLEDVVHDDDDDYEDGDEDLPAGHPRSKKRKRKRRR